jgi:excisionase family DNA binding protein
MRYTLGQAAKATGKTKSTIQRAIKTGKISAQFDGNAYSIDPAELHRVFLPANQRNSQNSNDLERSETVLNVQVERDRERRYLEKIIQDLTSDRDYWKSQAECLRLTSNQKKEKRGLLSRVVIAALDLNI